MNPTTPTADATADAPARPEPEPALGGSELERDAIRETALDLVERCCRAGRDAGVAMHTPLAELADEHGNRYVVVKTGDNAIEGAGESPGTGRDPTSAVSVLLWWSRDVPPDQIALDGARLYAALVHALEHGLRPQWVEDPDA